MKKKLLVTIRFNTEMLMKSGDEMVIDFTEIPDEETVVLINGKVVDIEVKDMTLELNNDISSVAESRRWGLATLTRNGNVGIKSYQSLTGNGD